MSSSTELTSAIDLYTGAHGAATSHPKLTPGESQPFTLLKNPVINGYRLSFFQRLDPQVRPDLQVRVYAKGFGTSPAETLWSTSLVIDRRPGDTRYLIFYPPDLRGSTHIWIGSWWDDGTYPGTPEGIQAYFTAHPEGGEHHTTPILVG